MKILEIGSYPPPNNGWSVRIKFLKEGFARQGVDCKVLNIGPSRKIKNPEYIDVQSGFDYLRKLIRYRFNGYLLHIHMNGQAVKGPILALLAQLVSFLSGKRAALTFHGGVEQLYFPKKNAGKMFLIIYMNFLLSRLIICNNLLIKKEIAKYGPFIDIDKVNPIPAFSVQYLNYNNAKLPERIDAFLKKKKHVVICYIKLRHGFLVEHTVEFLKKSNSDIGFILTGISEPEDDEVSHCYDELVRLEEKGIVLRVNDMDHNTFMTLLKRCKIYLRTHMADGVASSVLEAFMQGIPVVASDNGSRPPGVITYEPGNYDDLNQKIDYVLENYELIKDNLKKPEVKDTLKVEILVLMKAFDRRILIGT